nr:MAG TPA: hypothetical protein [Caudoviricetes sp.]
MPSSTSFSNIVPGAPVAAPALPGAETKGVNDYPGALNAGWSDYFQWAVKDYEAWEALFDEAEAQRVKENDRWFKYYKSVYEDDMSWWKKIILFALNGVQLWALWKQFEQQKDLADKTYDLANRVQVIAEELFAFYKGTYLPQESALGGQISSYFGGAQCVNYEVSGKRFEDNMRTAFRVARNSLTRCTSSNCAPFTANDALSWAVEQSQALGNARNSAYRHEETLKDYKDGKWLDLRLKFIQVGRKVSADGQDGIMAAFNTFSSFGADPGAALSQLLGTLSNTVGQMISSPTAPNGQIPDYNKSNWLYQPYVANVMQSGDIHRAKTQKITYTG